MTRTEIESVLEGTGLPYEYYKFDEGSGIQPPFLVWYLPSQSGFYADNVTYVSFRSLVIELYTDEKDFSVESAVEAALEGAGLTFSWEETYLPEEMMYEKIYQMEVIWDECERE